MSNPDSFIDEVTEEVRRDRFYHLLRRWGWVAVLAVLLLVGFAAWTEWQRSQERAAAEAFGDGLTAALSVSAPAARLAALDEVPVETAGQQAILAMLRASVAADLEDGSEAEAARAELLSLAEGDVLPPIYRQLARLKVVLTGGSGDPATDAMILEDLSAPGAPFRHLALERQAMAALSAGEEDAAIETLTLLTQEAGVSEGARRRAAQLLVALGVSADPA
ncbi:MAG: hypothetical protein AAF919_03245 [Pseudomonadota bacterium]